MVFGALKAQASSGVLRTNWSSWSSFPSSGRLFWPLYARSWRVAWIGGFRVAVHARAGIDFVRLRLSPCSSVPTSARCPVPCVRTVPCVRGSARGGPGAASPLRGGVPAPPAPRSRAPAEVRLGDGEKARLRMVGRGRFSPRGGRCATEGGRDLGKRRVLAEEEGVSDAPPEVVRSRF